MTPLPIHAAITALAEVASADDMKALRERNEQRMAAARERLGDRYLLHPDNRVRPSPKPRGVLRVGR